MNYDLMCKKPWESSQWCLLLRSRYPSYVGSVELDTFRDLWLPFKLSFPSSVTFWFFSTPSSSSTVTTPWRISFLTASEIGTSFTDTEIKWGLLECFKKGPGRLSSLEMFQDCIWAADSMQGVSSSSTCQLPASGCKTIHHRMGKGCKHMEQFICLPLS